MLKSDLWNFSNAYNAVKGDITLKKTNRREFIDTRNRFLAFNKIMHHLIIAYQRLIMY